MNKWQKKYCDKHYGGNLPRSKQGKEQLELLGAIKDTVTVEFPNRTETYIVTEDDCDIPNGKISVSVLASNLVHWKLRGFKVTTK